MPVKKGTRGRPKKSRRDDDKQKKDTTPVILTETDVDEEHEAIESTIPNQAIKASVPHWFSEVDLNQRGVPSSDFPSWYFDVRIDKLREDIDELEKNIDMDLFRGKDLIDARKKLSMRKKRLDDILESRPKFNGILKDKVAKVAQELGDRIGDAMYRTKDKNKKLVDAHKEVSILTSPTIEVKSEIEADFYKQKNVRIVNGKVPRLQAEICWKTMRRALEPYESANTESLRR